MSWAPKDLEDELFDDLSNLTLQENPSFFNTVTEVNIPVIIKKLLDVKTKEQNQKKQNDAASEVELSITESLRVHGIESLDVIPKSSPLSACINKNDFSDSRFPLILEDKYFTLKNNNQCCTSNQANLMRQIPKSVCPHPKDESWGQIEQQVSAYDQWSKSPKPGEDTNLAVSNCPVNKSNKSRKNKIRTKMKKFDLTPQESPLKLNRMAPPGIYGVSYI